ncbi:UNVERIFIED_CONTAM: hypothetical protein Sradi_3794700 [Sesamum radiatum]|uniref:Uncharacterized protein n=1 Tax=Sesamum radiatum TaxID=300843 RepID=A0AAW2Q0C6_SESRA
MSEPATRRACDLRAHNQQPGELTICEQRPATWRARDLGAVASDLPPLSLDLK